VFAFKWIINEKKRIDLKTEEIHKTTEMFKKLSMEEKHVILKKSLEVKNKHQAELIKVTDGSEKDIRIDQFLKDEIVKLSQAKENTSDEVGGQILKRFESPTLSKEEEKEEVKKMDLSLDLSKINKPSVDEAKSPVSTNHLES